MFLCNGAIPTLTGRRMELRIMKSEDAAALFRIWSHPEVAPWLGAPPLSSITETEQLIALLSQMALEEENLRWSIVGPRGEVIGSCGYNSWQLPGAYRGEIGCDLSPDFWGRGYMKEALELVLEYGFITMGLNRIEAYCHPDNVRAQKLVGVLGFQREGLLQQYRHTPSGFQDVDLYALLRQEWR
ncbi:GNAT family N-acetyltransferase [Paenibacillus sp. 19GGS1-52]|uniref:GNAT family N-acetyltransferase n=1 Tax=Paenibacillus sp. 19GGS1-52 TaxID=2758563 RepID=UPI001EFA915E|nr:GNAT family protein [Paenibacillus sp. 19GGS1-52]ULO06995.1 GNAT family N-acetyltransferase [Paenibacillus sp. 19GGS1-52]